MLDFALSFLASTEEIKLVSMYIFPMQANNYMGKFHHSFKSIFVDFTLLRHIIPDIESFDAFQLCCQQLFTLQDFKLHFIHFEVADHNNQLTQSNRGLWLPYRPCRLCICIENKNRTYLVRREQEIKLCLEMYSNWSDRIKSMKQLNTSRQSGVKGSGTDDLRTY